MDASLKPISTKTLYVSPPAFGFGLGRCPGVRLNCGAGIGSKRPGHSGVGAKFPLPMLCCWKK